MHVTKMHGARNDFLIVDWRSAPLTDAPSFARWACDRRDGIGADGLIVLERAVVADVRMRTFNADGTEAQMCGNGIRCAARWLDEAGEGDRIAFETDAGIVRTEVLARRPEYSVRVAMGCPHVHAGSVPGFPEAAVVDTGNPHVVIFCANVHDVELERVAAALQEEAAFPSGTNVHTAAELGTRLLLVRHWERGVGLTMACGTGAVACAAVAIKRRGFSSPVEIVAPGGKLVVEWDGRGGAHLIGPAARVFDTEVRIGAGALS